jgi:hypothetical protein
MNELPVSNIEQALKEGRSLDQIKSTLIATGYSDTEIDQAISEIGASGVFLSDKNSIGPNLTGPMTVSVNDDGIVAKIKHFVVWNRTFISRSAIVLVVVIVCGAGFGAFRQFTNNYLANQNSAGPGSKKPSVATTPVYALGSKPQSLSSSSAGVGHGQIAKGGSTPYSTKSPGESCNELALSSAANGTTDDTTALQNFVNQAITDQKSSTTICLQPSLNLLVTSSINVNGRVSLNFNGSTIKKSSQMNGYALNVTSPSVSVANLNINGDGAGGGGIEWTAGQGKIDNINVSGTSGRGVDLTGNGSSLNIQNSSSDYNNSGQNGIGFAAGRNTQLVTNNTSATNNSRSGYFLTQANNSSISGSSANNVVAGLEVEATNNLAIPNYTSTSDWHYGIYLGGDSNACNIGTLNILNTGIAQGSLSTNGYGAGIEFFGATNCTINTINDTITYSGTSGYGVAIAHQGGNTGYVDQGSDNNTFENVNVTHTGNPGIDITGTSSNNTLVNADTTNCSVGVNIGEGTIDNNGNVFDNLALNHDWYGGIGIENSSSNVFKSVNATDVGSHYPSDNGKAVVRIIGTADSNVIDQINAYINQPIPAEPEYIIYGDSPSVNNSATLGTIQSGTYSTAQWIDNNGGNHFQ